jgi:hypothetical protein
VSKLKRLPPNGFVNKTQLFYLGLDTFLEPPSESHNSLLAQKMPKTFIFPCGLQRRKQRK